MLEKFAEQCEKLSRNFLPDTFVLMLLLTITAYGFSAWFTSTPAHNLLEIWNTGFWAVLPDSIQLALSITLIESALQGRIFKILIARFLSKIPASTSTAIWMISTMAIVIGWFHWGVAIVFCSILARETAKNLHQKKITLHYPLFAAAVYTCMLPAHSTQPGSLAISAGVAFFVPLLLSQLNPRRAHRGVKSFHVDQRPLLLQIITHEKARTFAEKFEQSYITNLIIGLFAVIFLIQSSKSSDFKLNLPNFNFMVLAIGLVLHRNPINYFTAFTRSARGFASLAIQMLFYGGVISLLQKSGLIEIINNYFIATATKDKLPFNAYVCELISKVFYPVGHVSAISVNWVDRANALGASVDLTTLATIYADHFGNMLHPFWAIPIARIMGLKCRDIMGYGIVIFFFVFPILAVALWNS